MVFTIVSFPFLFGVMFGDIGHGGIVFLVGILLCLISDMEFMKNEALAGIRSARYLILMMGGSAFIIGFFYNDFMSIPLQLSNSCYYASPWA